MRGLPRSLRALLLGAEQVRQLDQGAIDEAWVGQLIADLNRREW